MSGIIVLSLGSAQRDDEAKREFASLLKTDRASLALACAQMGVGENPKAVATLRRACKECEPLTVLIQALPMLAPLHGLRSFRTVLDEYRPLGKRPQ